MARRAYANAMKKLTVQQLFEILKPRTPAEKTALAAIHGAASGEFADSDLDDLRSNRDWRTLADAFRGHEFCSSCSLIIGADQCDECGQSQLGTLPDMLDCVFTPTADMIQLVCKAMLQTDIPPTTVLKALHQYNEKCISPLPAKSVDCIFVEAASALKAERKRGAA